MHIDLPCPPGKSKIKKGRNEEIELVARPVSGQVGQGDLLDRLQPCPITRLNRLGIVKIATGEKHAVAITVTGRALGWGDNAQKQVVAGLARLGGKQAAERGGEERRALPDRREIAS